MSYREPCSESPSKPECLASAKNECQSSTQIGRSLSTAAGLPSMDTSLVAWLQVAGGFLVMFNTWGIAFSYGVFQAYYENGNFIKATPSAIAWIGSTQTALLLLIGGLCGRLFDAGYLYTLLRLGWFLVSFGLMMTSLCHKFWQVFLSQSVCVGTGMGCLLVPSLGTVGTWFDRRRGIAFGIVSSGGAIGAIILPIILQRLLEHAGFPWTIRVLGFISSTTLALGGLLLRQRLPPRVQGALFEWNALKEPAFSSFTLGYCIVSMGLYVFPQFVQSWAEATGFNLSFPTAYYLPLIYAASIPGRIVLNHLSDRLGPLNVQIPCILAAATIVLAWLAVESVPSMFIVTLLYGFVSGGLVSLPLSVLTNLTTDQSKLGARMGVFFVTEAGGVWLGTPIAGAIIGKSNQQGRWDGVRAVW